MLSLYHPFHRADPFSAALALWGRELREQPAWVPRADIAESEKSWLVKVELPGLRKEDVNVTLKEGVLTVSGKRESEKKEESDKDGVKYLRVESSCGAFERSFRVPEDVDPQGISAKCVDGILRIEIPKPQEKIPKDAEIEVS